MISHVEYIIRAVLKLKALLAHGIAAGARGGHRAEHGRYFRQVEGQAQPRNRRHHQRNSRQSERRRSRSLDVDFTQVLQDMIGDLTGRSAARGREAFFSRCRPACAPGRRAWPMRSAEFTSMARSRWWISRTASKTAPAGPRWSSRESRRRPPKAGFTTDQITTAASAIVDGEPATTPVIINDRPYTLRVRFPQQTARRSRP